MDRIESAETWYPRPETAEVGEPATWVPLLQWSPRAGRPYDPPTPIVLKNKKVHKQVTVEAYINTGRWIAECPHCHSAQVASITDPRFLCIECHNIQVDGQWIKVEFPGEKTRQQIENTLLARPHIENRHWYPHEKLKDLKDENREHKLPESV